MSFETLNRYRALEKKRYATPEKKSTPEKCHHRNRRQHWMDVNTRTADQQFPEHMSTITSACNGGVFEIL
jgi:hypothetical protein